MSGITIQVDDAALRRAINTLLLLGQNPGPMLKAWGVEVKSEARGAFDRRGLPGDPRWPDKPEHWAQWEGGKNVPLTYRGRLAGSVQDEVQGHTLRVGSALNYAATHQLGDERPRAFYVHLIPELEASPHGGMRIAHFPNGYPKGRLTLRQAFTGEGSAGRQATEAARHLSGSRKAASPHRGVIRVLVKQPSIHARPFLPMSPGPQLMGRLYDIAAGFLLGNFKGAGQ